MQKEKTLFISDLDGTLLTRSGSLSEFTISNVHKLISNDYNFTIATARPFALVKTIIETLKIKLPLVINNGGIIYDPIKKRAIKVCTINKDTIDTVFKTLNMLKVIPFVHAIDADGNINIYYSKIVNKCQEKQIEFANILSAGEYAVKVDDVQEIENIFYFTIVCESMAIEKIKPLLAKSEDISLVSYTDVYTPGYSFLEIGHKNATKAHGLEDVKEIGQYEDVIAFGDNYNDVDMFLAADVGYAVLEAPKELKDVADMQIGSAKDDSVIKKILKIIGDIE